MTEIRKSFHSGESAADNTPEGEPLEGLLTEGQTEAGGEAGNQPSEQEQRQGEDVEPGGGAETEAVNAGAVTEPAGTGDSRISVPELSESERKAVLSQILAGENVHVPGVSFDPETSDGAADMADLAMPGLDTKKD